MVRPLQTAARRPLRKLKLGLPSAAPAPLPAGSPKKRKTLVGKEMCLLVFTAASFTISSVWGKTLCVSIDGCMKMYFPAVNDSEILHLPQYGWTWRHHAK